ncbi:MAG TPA: TonB-dependent receptor [Nevskiaceae bacterium]|nr:TonB-dependent receptor [Nevskiaceae bacterium]
MRCSPRALALGLLVAGGAATAQDATVPVDPPAEDAAAPAPAPADAPLRLDEIVVTAQKKAENIQDVPISMSVVDQKFIANWGLTDVREAMLAVPNVKVEEAGFFASPRVRGFSFNNNNKAFEPPAGVALDGIPYTRVEYFNAALFDIARIEVMRGPQGTTFGKNTTAGLIHVLTADPTGDLTGFVDVQAGEFERRRVEAAVAGPLFSDAVQFRLAAFSDERQGFVDNTTADVSDVARRHLRGTDRNGVRAKLRFPELLGSELKLAVEHVSLGSLGAGAELYHASEAMRTTLLRYDPATDFEKNNGVASIDQPDGRRVKIDTVSGEWTRPIGTWTVTALAGHSVLKNDLDVDTDFTPAPAIFGHDEDRSPTSTLEIRTQSPDFDGLFGLGGTALGSSSLLVGVYGQERAIEGSGFEFRIGTVPFLEITVAAAQDDPAQAILDALPLDVRSLLFAALPVLPAGGVADEEVQQGFDQDAEAVAVFGQVDWAFTQRWALELGARLNHERKRADWNSVYTTAGPNVVLALAGITEFEAHRSEKETEFQPKVALSFALSDDLKAFVHYARAYKGGGFNAFAFRDVDDELVYDPETATEWGADLKGTLLDGRIRANLSIYRLDIDDFQVLTRIPDALTIGLGVTKVENAAKARAQGVEGDVTWLATEWLTLIAAAAYNDTEYLDFKTNDCPADMDNTDGDDDERCDATGRPFAFAPKYNGALIGQTRFPLGARGFELTGGAAMEFQSKTYLDIDLDERKTQDAFARFRATLGVGNPRQGWSFKIVGENLTDKRTSIRQGDVVPGLFVSAQEPPRQVYGQFRYSF